VAELLGDRREALLEAAAQSEGTAWSTWWLCELRRQNRPIAGGWPGTLSEARRRMSRRIATELGPRFSLTHAELDQVARRAYDHARRDWNLNSERDLDG
jgi:hypothetical protein